MRVFIAITFIAVVLLNLFGFYMAFIMNRNEIRREMQQHLRQADKDELTVMTMSREEYDKLVWVKENREFRLNGRMFDVEEVQIADDQVILYVEEDHKETRLNDDFASAMSDKDSSSGPLRNLFQYFLKEFTQTTDSVATILPRQLPLYGNRGPVLYVSYIRNCPSPPPDARS